MPMRLKTVLSLEEYDDDIVEIAVARQAGGAFDEIVGVVPWRDKVVIATNTHILILEEDEETEVILRSLMETYRSELERDTAIQQAQRYEPHMSTQTITAAKQKLATDLATKMNNMAAKTLLEAIEKKI